MDDQLVEFMQEQAAHEAEDHALGRLQQMADRALRDRKPESLEPVKATLRRNKKKMRTCSYYLCDRCEEPIVDPEDGYVFHGNVYVASTDVRGGLIGNNFPDVPPGTPIKVEDVEESVFCCKCLMDVMGLKKHFRLKTDRPETQAVTSVGTGRAGYGERGWRRSRPDSPGSYGYGNTAPSA